MIYEYAVDPVSINNWQDFRYVVERFGSHHGRLIAEYPEKWFRLVYKECKGSCKPVELKKIEEILSSIKDRIIKTNRQYIGTKDWLENAEDSQSSQPFRAILSYHNPRNQVSTLVVREITEETALWRVERQATVPRKAEKMAVVISSLLQLSSEIIFVDPHYHPLEPRFNRPIEYFAKEITQSKKSITRIEYHLLAKTDLPTVDFERFCTHNLSHLLPVGMKIKFIRWKKFEAWEANAAGKRLHPRFVLTDIGGVNIEWGLDEGLEEECVDITLLERSSYADHWAKYQRATSPFEYVDEVEITGSM